MSVQPLRVAADVRDACTVCSLWPQDGETDAHWKARLRGIAAPSAPPPACRHGHPWTEANTYRTPPGYRVCRTCSRSSVSRYRQRREVAR